jgi:hypothetical protein
LLRAPRLAGTGTSGPIPVTERNTAAPRARYRSSSRHSTRRAVSSTASSDVPGWVGVAEGAAGDHAAAVHLPDIDFAAVVLPHDVGITIVLEIASPDRVPARPGFTETADAHTGPGHFADVHSSNCCSAGECRRGRCRRNPGFISQTTTPPLSFCQTMSELPLANPRSDHRDRQRRLAGQREETASLGLPAPEQPRSR